MHLRSVSLSLSREDAASFHNTWGLFLLFRKAHGPTRGKHGAEEQRVRARPAPPPAHTKGNHQTGVRRAPRAIAHAPRAAPTPAYTEERPFARSCRRPAPPTKPNHREKGRLLPSFLLETPRGRAVARVSAAAGRPRSATRSPPRPSPRALPIFVVSRGGAFRGICCVQQSTRGLGCVSGVLPFSYQPFCCRFFLSHPPEAATKKCFRALRPLVAKKVFPSSESVRAFRR